MGISDATFVCMFFVIAATKCTAFFLDGIRYTDTRFIMWLRVHLFTKLINVRVFYRKEKQKHKSVGF